MIIHLLQLSPIAFLGNTASDDCSIDRNKIMDALLPAFYNKKLLEGDNTERVICWIKSWLSIASKQAVQSSDAMTTLMRNTSPKYVPREWMLIDAYTKANEGDYTVSRNYMTCLSSHTGLP